VNADDKDVRRHPCSIWASTSRCAQAHATLDRRPSHCCACHFDGHHLSDDRSALPHLWLGTHCHLPSASEMTCILSSGALNSTHSPLPPAMLNC